MIDPAIGALLTGAFALLFASAALHKLRDRAAFGRILRAYGVLPAPLAGLALLVPLLELTVGAALLTAGARTGAAASGAALLVTYAAAIAINLGRGRRDLACGCGGANDERPIAAWMVWRNLTLAALLALTLLAWSPRALGAADAITIGAGTSAAALLYMSVDTLLGRVRPRAALLRGAP
jgi:Methylamine utilisation protein MauE